ncbi:zinc-binding alcohol dehydrogenase family protein [Arenibacter sp. GZD96]|uniref:zinc-binding alcohol dehydrogenase family protein n=1 Tax=Aurantibrevibacter litoralis TaxID=3106030 RepID=UPI002AFE3D1E|nr:zinc-binding alcohol dehydrogenase family protein [Arenibacter sp. GZD-96]MEA1786175.1 zinc-binding alcohol dehydrogenase family protein [Arenibacter sp. GZD-96]
MKYIVCEKPGRFLMKEKNKPERNPGEALLRIKKVGVCGTDLHAYSGNQAFFTYPRILGHELAAEVVAIDENQQGIQVGNKVAIMPYVSCGVCVACRQGKTNCCVNMQVLGVHTDGGMQEQISVPIDLLLPAQHLRLEEIALVEPLAIAAHALARAQLKAGETIAVIGCGPIGIGIIKLAQIAGAHVIVVDVNKQRLQYVQDYFDAAHCIVADEKTKVTISDITKGNLCNVVFDATGHKGALEAGINYMAHGGRYVLVGLSKGELTFLHPAIHAKETTLLCSRNATITDFKYVMEILEKGLFPTSSFITHTVDAAQMISHFDGWLDPSNGVIKAMVNF